MFVQQIIKERKKESEYSDVYTH